LAFSISYLLADQTDDVSSIADVERRRHLIKTCEYIGLLTITWSNYNKWNRMTQTLATFE